MASNVTKGGHGEEGTLETAGRFKVLHDTPNSEHSSANPKYHGYLQIYQAFPEAEYTLEPN